MTTNHSGQATVDDMLAAIDAATGCQQCSGPLEDSPSDEFCSAVCQTQWHAARTVPLANYREPVDLAAHYSNLVEGRSPETTPPGYSASQPCGCGVCQSRRDFASRVAEAVSGNIEWRFPVMNRTVITPSEAIARLLDGMAWRSVAPAEGESP